MSKIPTKIEMAQYHAMNAPFGKLRDEADRQLEIETEKRLARRENKAQTPKVELETPFMSRLMKSYKEYIRPIYDAGTIWLARNNNGQIIKRFVQFMAFGLGAGTSDYIGCKSIIITPDMVGKQIAVFMAVEGKRYKDGAPDERQEKFIKAIHAMGGIALVVNAEEELEARKMIAEAMP